RVVAPRVFRFAHTSGPQHTLEPLDLLEQLERERRAGEIDLEIALQAEHALHARDGKPGEPPRVRRRAARLDDAFGHDVDHDLLIDGADTAELRQAEFCELVEQIDVYRVRLAHDRPSRPSISARGFIGMLCAISL